MSYYEVYLVIDSNLFGQLHRIFHVLRSYSFLDRLEMEKADLDNRLSMLREQKLNEEGIMRLCQLLAKNIDRLTKNQWEVLNKLLKLKITVYSKELAIVNVALPPVSDTRDAQIEFSRL